MAPVRNVPLVVDRPKLPAKLDCAGADDLRSETEHEELEWCDADLRGVAIEAATVQRSRFRRVQFTAAVLQGASLTDVIFEDCELSGVTLTGASLHRVAFRRCRMSCLVATDIEAMHLTAVESKMDEAWLRGGKLNRCEFDDVDLTEADLYGATIEQSRILRSRLDGADFSHATIRGLALHGSSLDRIKGGRALRGLVIGSDQIVPISFAVLPGLDISVDDDYLRAEPPGSNPDAARTR